MKSNIIIIMIIIFVTLHRISRAEGEQDSNKKDIFSTLSEYGLSLKKASSGSDAGEPAELGYLKYIGGVQEYHADFYLQWQPKYSYTFGSTVMSYSFAIESKLSSTDTSTNDALRFSLGTQFDIKNSTYSKNSLWLSIDAKHESDCNLSAKKVYGALQISPSIPIVAIGNRWPNYHANEKQPPVQFSWRPIFEYDVGYIYDYDSVASTEDTIIMRVIPRIRAEIFLNFITHAIGMNNVYLYADNSFFFFPLETNNKKHNYFVAGSAFMFTKNLGLSVTYKYGENYPKFTEEHSIGSSFSITF